MSRALFTSHLKSLPRWQHGKVRDMYEIDRRHLLIVNTDRLSVFDVVLPTAIPRKGQVLTTLSHFWMNRLSHVIPNNLSGFTPDLVLFDADDREQVRSRSVVVKRIKPLPVEAIVRGYIVGSGWEKYREKGDICGLRLPRGLQLAEQLPSPVFTPSTRSALGELDENINFDAVRGLIGADLAIRVRDVALQLYREVAVYARGCGIIIADTKFKFGLDTDGQLLLIDEAVTPDSSRFWSVDDYRVGQTPPSFEKQYIRDFLLDNNWNRADPPELPDDVVLKTAEKYQEILTRFMAGRRTLPPAS